MDILIVPYNTAHRQVVCEVWYNSFESSGLRHDPGTSVAQLLVRWDEEISTRWRAIVAISGERFLGFAAYAPMTRHLHQLFVDPRAQRAGVGVQLLNAVKEQCPEGFTLNTHVENKGARRFYEREGLVHSETKPHPRYGHMMAVYRWR